MNSIKTDDRLDEIREYVQSLLYKDEVLAIIRAKSKSIYILISNNSHSLFKILRISDHYSLT